MEYYECNEAELKEVAGKFIRPFDLNNDHLIRVALVKYDQNKHLLMFDFVITSYSIHYTKLYEKCLLLTN